MILPRTRRILLGALLIYPFWLAMMAVHELGHVLGAIATGGTVTNVSIPLLGFSRTDVSPNPWPQVEVWCGPIIGAALPLVLAWALLRTRARIVALLFAGWCLIANGAYIGIGWIDRVGDAGELVRHGTSTSLLIAFGVAACGVGLYIWHLLGAAPNR
jgi:hypothetical protein